MGFIEKLNCWLVSSQISHINICLNSILGEGQFGEIHLCRIIQSAKGLPDDLNTYLVAVKSLRKNCDQASRSDFEHEARILSSLNDPNLGMYGS